MAYTPSPRPVFNKPSHIPYQTVTRHLWGDSISGEVSDWIYVSSEKIHHIVFGLPPGKWFRHSEDFRTVFAADEFLYVLSGNLVLSNPEFGEVHQVGPGEAAFFRRDTWHHAYNHSTEPLRVLEVFAPPPAQGTSGAYARTRPYLERARYTQDDYLSRWPPAHDSEVDRTIRVLRETDMMWRLEGHSVQTLVGIWVSTEDLTVGDVTLLPGEQTDCMVRGGDVCVYLLEGSLNIHVPKGDDQQWFELEPRDGFYLPTDTEHQFYNMSGEPARFLFGVAPSYTEGAR